VHVRLEDGGDSNAGFRRLLASVGRGAPKRRIRRRPNRYSHPGLPPLGPASWEHRLLDPGRLELPIEIGSPPGGGIERPADCGGAGLLGIRDRCFRSTEVGHWGGLPVLPGGPAAGLGTLRATTAGCRWRPWAQRGGVPLVGACVFKRNPSHGPTTPAPGGPDGAPVLACRRQLASLTAQTLAAAAANSGLRSGLTCNVAP